MVMLLGHVRRSQSFTDKSWSHLQLSFGIALNDFVLIILAPYVSSLECSCNLSC